MENTSQVANFICTRIAVVGKPPEAIAEYVGFESPNVVVQIKNGEVPLPFEKIGALAKFLQTDPFTLWGMCMEEYQPTTWKAISPFMEVGLTADERLLVNNFRFFAGGPYVAALTEESQGLLKEFLDSLRGHKTIQ